MSLLRQIVAEMRLAEPEPETNVIDFGAERDRKASAPPVPSPYAPEEVVAAHMADRAIEVEHGLPAGSITALRREAAGRVSAPDKTAAVIIAKSITWLWFGRIAKGKLTITDGNPGVGKSARQIDTAARLSTGSHWPDCPKTCPGHKAANVGMVSAEDEDDDTIVPRLMAAGADMTRVYLYQGFLSIPDDMGEFESWIARNGLVFVALDPLSAHVSDKHDLNHEQKTRRALEPLQDLLARTRCALEGLRHTNKQANVTSAMDKGSGSRAIGGASRANLFIARDPADPDTMVFASVKGNNTVAVPSLTYQIHTALVIVEDAETGDPVTVPMPVIAWTGTSELTADDLLKIERGKSKVEIAVDFLEAILKDGPMSVATVDKLAAQSGISIEGALKTARKRMTELGELTNYQKPGETAGGWYLALTATRDPLEENE